MPREIDTGGPRVLHRNPGCPQLIDLNDEDNSVRPNDDEKIHHSIIWHKLSRESWRIRKREWREKFRRKQMSKSNSATCVFRGQNDVAVKGGNEEAIDIDRQEYHRPFAFLSNQHGYREPINKVERDPRLRIIDVRGLPEESSQCYSSTKNPRYSSNHQRQHDSYFDKSDKKSDVYKVNIERRRKTRINRRSRLFNLDIVLLLLLIVIGHGKLVRTSLGFATAGTLFGSVDAAPVDLDAGIRAERSANLSHITGASRKIQMYIKNRHLQILPDGTVNGSNDDTSDYTIFQRTSVSRGQLRIQGVATCLYLCMDSCGLLYGSREYTEDCVFNETLEQHNYNTYSSVRWSTARKTLYLGLNRHGQPRRVQARGHNLGRLSAYARVLTQVAPADRVEALQTRMLGAQHGVRHHHNAHHHRNIQQSICPTLPAQEKDGRDRFRCRKRKKRKKRKRHCEIGEQPGPHCELHQRDNSGRNNNAEVASSEGPASKRSCEDAASDEFCRRQALDAPSKKRKSRIEIVKGEEDNNQTKKDTKKKSSKKTNASDTSDGQPGKRTSGAKRNNREPVSKRNNNQGKKRIPNRSARTTVPVLFNYSNNTHGSLLTTPATITLSKHKFSSPRNAVTHSIKVDSRMAKSLGQSKLPESTSTISITDSDDTSLLLSPLDVSAEPSLATDDLSAEISGEDLASDDDQTTLSLDYGTQMTTMDTTSPERTKDYTKATAPTFVESLGAKRTKLLRDDDDPINASRLLNGFSLGRLAM